MTNHKERLRMGLLLEHATRFEFHSHEPGMLISVETGRDTPLEKTLEKMAVFLRIEATEGYRLFVLVEAAKDAFSWLAATPHRDMPDDRSIFQPDDFDEVLSVAHAISRGEIVVPDPDDND